MKKNIIYLLSFFINLGLQAQDRGLDWQNLMGGTANDFARCIQPTVDGGYIMAGFTLSTNGDVSGNHGKSDAWVVKLSSAGNLQWQVSLGGSENDYAYSIQSTIDGGYIMAGITFSTDGDVIGNHGLNDAWVVKLSSTGSIEWQKALGGSNKDQADSIQTTLDGGFIMAGSSASNDGDVLENNGFTDPWIVKLSSTGNIQWEKNLGGTNADNGCSIQPTADGGYIMAGYTGSADGDVLGNHGGYDAWVVKLSSMGSIEWQNALRGTVYDFGYSIQPTVDGGYIMLGSTTSKDGDVSGNYGLDDAWIVKLSSTGNLQWQKTLGGTGYDHGYSIQTTTDGDYFMAGDTTSDNGDVSGNHGSYDAWVVRLSNTGSIIWQKAMGGFGQDYGYCIQPTADGGSIMAGYSESVNGVFSENNGGIDAWVVKLKEFPLKKDFFVTQELQIYPNPSQKFLYLQTINNTGYDKIIITDLAGKKVLEQTSNTYQVNIEKLADGFYIIKAFSGEDEFVNKFVKE